jgi:hypothetical protein
LPSNTCPQSSMRSPGVLSFINIGAAIDFNIINFDQTVKILTF